MTSQRTIGIIAILVGIILVILVLYNWLRPAQAQQPPSGGVPTATVSPASGPPDTHFSVSGTGGPPNTQVASW